MFLVRVIRLTAKSSAQPALLDKHTKEKVEENQTLSLKGRAHSFTRRNI